MDRLKTKENDMGLVVSHDCWDGGYRGFMVWRQEIAKAAGIPPLELMEGFYRKNDAINDPVYWMDIGFDNGKSKHFDWLRQRLPITWEALRPDALHELLNHSDCDGEISWELAEIIANRLEEIFDTLPMFDESPWKFCIRETTLQFIRGLRLAHKLKENVEFY